MLNALKLSFAVWMLNMFQNSVSINTAIDTTCNAWDELVNTSNSNEQEIVTTKIGRVLQFYLMFFGNTSKFPHLCMFSVNEKSFGSHQTMEQNTTTTAPSTIDDDNFCKSILYEEIANSSNVLEYVKAMQCQNAIPYKQFYQIWTFEDSQLNYTSFLFILVVVIVRIWDLSIIIPNMLFLFFLLIRFNRACLKLRATSSPIFSTFYTLVVLNAVISCVRCIVSMTVNAATASGDLADKILWIVVRFFLLSTEISVLIFGLAFGHLDSRTSIQRVLFVTSFIALIYSGTQAALEFAAPDKKFYISSAKKGIFAHGGMLFWFMSSLLFTLIYLTVLILPWTKLRDRLALPSKQSFYWYALFLALLNITQSIGSGLLYYGLDNGLCVVDVTAYIYFTIFIALMYRTFLADFFSISQPSIMFSYKAQVDDVVEDDNVSLPHQLSCSSLKTDSDYIYQNNSLYESTHFDAANVNPLYTHSLQSPDSFPGFEVPAVGTGINTTPQHYQRSSIGVGNVNSP